ncbi:MAG: type II 3-dehydroquinate dehydratase [Bacteroidales bacterium]
MKILIINGPNLNFTGKRETTVYGTVSFEEYLKKLQQRYAKARIDYFQSNIEGEIIDALQKAGFLYDGIILNAGGYTHSSVSIGDAVKLIDPPVVEVHISNIYGRESYRHTSLIAPHARGVVIGFGLSAYRLALESFLE